MQNPTLALDGLLRRTVAAWSFAVCVTTAMLAPAGSASAQGALARDLPPSSDDASSDDASSDDASSDDASSDDDAHPDAPTGSAFLAPPEPAPPRALTAAEVARCSRDVYRGLRPIARVEVARTSRDRAVFTTLARARCPGLTTSEQALARLVVRAWRSHAAQAELFERLVAERGDPGCNPLAFRPEACAPRLMLVAGVQGSEGYDRVDVFERYALVRLIDALSVYPELLPLAQLIWGVSHYDGGCPTWDLAGMHDDLRHGVFRRQPYRPMHEGDRELHARRAGWLPWSERFSLARRLALRGTTPEAHANGLDPSVDATEPAPSSPSPDEAPTP